ncbi:hypothetical protein LRD18_02245, partial [Halorhodospira halochloris]|uniref:hypothetical protein n=1 Tax=Halorhodospira halochloris TaxID=1052 RepID=UPI001EE8BACE
KHGSPLHNSPYLASNPSALNTYAPPSNENEPAVNPSNWPPAPIKELLFIVNLASLLGLIFFLHRFFGLSAGLPLAAAICI